MDAFSADPGSAAVARTPEDAFRELDRVALRTEAHARHRARVRVTEARRLPTAPAGSAGSGPPRRGGTADRATPEVAVLPGLPSWLPAVLGVLRGSAAVLRAQHTGDGAARDFLVVGANHLELSGVERDPRGLLGRSLSQTRPGIRASGMYDVYRAALEGRGPVAVDDLDYVDLVDGGLQRGRLRGTVVLLPDEGLLLTNWEPVGDVRLSHRIQERSRLGWAEWDLVSGRMRWSHGLRRLLDLPTAPGAAAEPEHGLDGEARSVTSVDDVTAELLELRRRIVPEDVPAFAADMSALLRGGEVVDREVTLRVAGRERRIRWIGHAEPEGAGVPDSLLFTARNVTGQEELLSRALTETERLRREAAVDRRVSETFRQALTPPLGVLTAPWLSVGAVYVPSDSGVGGDWYKCRELPDGRVLLAVGDASGHGVDAASRAVQQRSALAGLAYTDQDAAALTTALGEVVYYSGLDTTATCVVGHLHPRARVLRWASAGHPTPILVRDGVPRLLEAEHGLMLGVTAHAAYPLTTTRLYSGDLLLCYTDGVIEHRGMDLDEGVAALMAAARECAERGTSAQEAVDCLAATLLGREAEDDATILALCVT
ncbi:PP2C family protein-serine/threonine phosphatase [Streptomyces sp. NPDC006925]|uniref:PP2C family protein-serine/threonine phosphatase n=1 Tax=Streptomyces sp. NPDC006925 TaxID=3364768 RepID=UPI0036BA05B0